MTHVRAVAAAIAYVGDRVDNDIRPARAAGMMEVFVGHGPWGWIQVARGRPPEALRSLP